jgi:hypothetical protein
MVVIKNENKIWTHCNTHLIDLQADNKKSYTSEGQVSKPVHAKQFGA